MIVHCIDTWCATAAVRKAFVKITKVIVAALTPEVGGARSDY